jgi:hypothetical protein
MKPNQGEEFFVEAAQGAVVEEKRFFDPGESAQEPLKTLEAIRRHVRQEALTHNSHLAPSGWKFQAIVSLLINLI